MSVTKKIPQKKVDMVVELKKKIDENPNFLLTDYRGLTVGQITKLRKKLYEQNIEYRVIKNNLFKIALKEQNIEGLENLLIGPVAITFCKDDPVFPSKILVDFTKESPLKLKGGYVEGGTIDKAGIETLSRIPSKNDVLANIMGCLNAPATNLLRYIQDSTTKIAMLITELGKKKENEEKKEN